ncbi:MAG: polymerase subunit sigma-70 [Caulobacter sp.]|nr:polymerase subunit sigma-70 [Caulobacter sp.]
MTINGLHDVELAALSAVGDRKAYGELVRRHSRAVRGLLRRMGADPAAADDAAQDAFLTGFEQIADFRGAGAFAGWIKKIAARHYLRRIKRDARMSWGEAVDGPDQDAVQEPQAAAYIDLDDALRTLSEAERLSVSLCYGADLSHAEAAEALNLPLGTVKSHVKRGLDKLRARLVPPSGSDERRQEHG